MDRLWNYLNSGVNPSSTVPGLLARIRLLNVAHAMLLCLSPIFGSMLLLDGRWASALNVAFLMSLVVANGLVLRRTRNMVFCGTLFGLLCTGHLAYEAIEMRHPATFYWFYLMPLLGALLGGLRSGWILTVASMAVATYVFLVPAPQLPAEFSETHLLTVRVFSMLCVGVFTTLFVQAQRSAERVQLDANHMLLRESARTRLLSEVSAAAHGAATVGEAMQACVEKVSVILGWPMGHGWMVDDWYNEPKSHSWWLSSGGDLEGVQERLLETRNRGTCPLGESLLRAREPVWIDDLGNRLEPDTGLLAREVGLCVGMAVPVMVGGERVGIFEFFTGRRLVSDPRLLSIMEHVADQVGRVAERNRAEARIRTLAFYDILTGLPNRQMFSDQLEKVLLTADRKGGSFALLFIDLDGFKNVNDSLGHAAGDELLKEIGRRLRNGIRPTDTLAVSDDDVAPVSRLAGDEFTVLVRDLSEPIDAGHVAQRLLQLLAEPYDLFGYTIYPSASIGIAVYPADGEDSETLLGSADAAMYYAKNLGRNQYQYFRAAMNAEGARALEIESRLRGALDRGDLHAYYQPMRDCKTSQVVAAEALLRWHDEELGEVTPLEFIPVAEKTGLINSIGLWVVRTACEQMRRWCDEGNRPIRLSVNVSTVQIRRVEFVNEVIRALEEFEIPANWLELEITESAIMQNDDVTHETIGALSQLGVGIALDDFGVGYSSLSYLRRFPIDALKIDRSFVREIPDNADDCALTSAVIAMAHGLRLRVVAEGVETEEQAQFLRDQECDELQGFLFSRAVPASEFEQFLRPDKED